ncbi:uncharacterized protein LOC135836527 [Planococcus citri]|uniref:uncharacterized protein LOC135836527 n=1 Tax=Planococcus citri TaxID=170843 RepID=UPI0031F8A2DD
MNSVTHVIAVCLLIVQFAFIYTIPVPENTSKPDTDDEIVYDQRQNGSENLRIHMNDVTLVVAPSDGILQLMSASASDFLNNNNEVSGSNSNKPQGGPNVYSLSDCGSDNGAKCKQQTHKKNRIRLSSLLVPLLNRATGN